MNCECINWGREASNSRDEHHIWCKHHPSHNKEWVSCIICNKQIGAYDGGNFEISFGCMSKYDIINKLKGEARDKANPIDKLLSYDIIKGYICDDCFDKKVEKLHGCDRFN